MEWRYAYVNNISTGIWFMVGHVMAFEPIYTALNGKYLKSTRELVDLHSTKKEPFYSQQDATYIKTRIVIQQSLHYQFYHLSLICRKILISVQEKNNNNNNNKQTTPPPRHTLNKIRKHQNRRQQTQPRHLEEYTLQHNNKNMINKNKNKKSVDHFISSYSFVTMLSKFT